MWQISADELFNSLAARYQRRSKHRSGAPPDEPHEREDDPSVARSESPVGSGELVAELIVLGSELADALMGEIEASYRGEKLGQDRLIQSHRCALLRGFFGRNTPRIGGRGRGP
jgi:hypothetical protein